MVCLTNYGPIPVNIKVTISAYLFPLSLLAQHKTTTEYHCVELYTFYGSCIKLNVIFPIFSVPLSATFSVFWLN